MSFRPQGVRRLRGWFITGAAIGLALGLLFLLLFVAIMFAYRWELALLAIGLSLVIAGLSAAVTPLFRRRLSEQFQNGAQIQAFTTEYVSGLLASPGADDQLLRLET
jgi:ATP-binding cassette, subfamily B, bacterial HlyB/CyaB